MHTMSLRHIVILKRCPIALLVELTSFFSCGKEPGSQSCARVLNNQVVGQHIFPCDYLSDKAYVLGQAQVVL